MEIIFNGAPENPPQNILSELLTAKGMSDKTGIAVAINQKVIPRNQWESFILNPSDSVLVIKATQGG